MTCFRFHCYLYLLCSLCKQRSSLFSRRHPISEKYLYETAMDRHAARFSIISTVVNQPVIQPFLFTNYRHHPDKCEHAHYQSGCELRLWEAVMASTAAPGFFEEVRLGPHILQVCKIIDFRWSIIANFNP